MTSKPKGVKVIHFKENDAKVLWEGAVKLKDGKGTLETSLDKPGMILTTLSIKPKHKKAAYKSPKNLHTASTN